MRQHLGPGPHSGTESPARGLLGALLFAAAAGVYFNALHGPLIFDDWSTVTENPSIRHGWALWHALAPPPGGLTASGRPVANLSFALNYLVSGEAVWSYHVFNVLVHGAAALALFGIIRRTTGRDWAAWGLSLIWAVHPLNTESVTYIAQRVESMEGMFLLLTLYCFIRSVEEPHGPETGGDLGEVALNLKPRSGMIYCVLSVFACALGMATKETMAVAPVIVLLYDRTFVASGFTAALRARWRYYAALAGTWVLLAFLIASNGGNRGGTVGLGAGVSPWAYWLTQFPAIVHYLRLAVWPAPLIFEYGKFWEPGLAAVWPQAAVVAALVAATIVALRRKPVLGFLGSTFFLLLAPTALPPGTKQMIVEHRMYLPLIAVICATTFVVERVLRTRSASIPLSLPILLALALPLALATLHRNHAYRSELALWQDTVEKRPTNPVAHCNYGVALFEAGQPFAALDQYRTALALDPANAEAEYDLANALAQTGRVPEALARFESALGRQPADAKARCNYANTLILAHRPAEALEQFQLALKLDPGSSRAYNDLGFALAGMGRMREALEEYDQAAALKPGDPQIAYNRGAALAQAGRLDEAAREDRRALRLQPNFPEAHNNLANVLARSGQPAAALPEYAEAIRQRPDYWQARFNCANALLQLGRPAEARQQLREVLREHPGFQPALDAL